MPSNPLQINTEASIMNKQLHYIIMCFYLPLFFKACYRILQEKSSRVKEMMRIMGMSDFSYWISWWIYMSLVNLFIVATAGSILVMLIFPKSDNALLYLWLWLFGQSVFSFVLLFQTFFQDPKTGTILAFIIYICMGAASLLTKEDYIKYSSKMILTLFMPPLAMSQGAMTLSHYEFGLSGIQFDTWDLSLNNFSMRDSIICLVGSQTIYTVIGLYLDRVLPNRFGERSPICFCFQGLGCRSKQKTQEGDAEQNSDNTLFETQFLHRDNYEPVPPEIAALEEEDLLLQISGLHKEYDNGFKAVNGINLKVYADQIFVLLGHNGAGKSTTMSVLTGLFETTKGSATVLGVDLFGDRFEARKFMGICPQYDVQFELLTPEEHLRFYYNIKGAEDDEGLRMEEIEMLMTDIGLADKRNAMAYQLSGGNKRKLSAAIALCGNSRFVIFDEPTAGMDLTARRQLWNMLKRYRKGRIILMSTHYMDEADILGDRIGIMAGGKLTCLGSGPFLKRKFGVGYNLTLVKTSNEPNQRVVPFIHKKLGKACHKQSEIQSEMSIKIPGEYIRKFSKFFDQLDSNLSDLGLQSYGISQTTLEEVFMNVGHLQDPTKSAQTNQNQQKTRGNERNSSSDDDEDSQMLDDDQYALTESDFQSSNGDADANYDGPITNQKGQEGAVILRQAGSSPQLTNRSSISSHNTFEGEELNDVQNNIDQAQQESEDVRQQLERHRRFNLRKNSRELDTSLLRNVWAQIYKKLCIYRNSKMTLVMDFMMPSLLLYFGLCAKFGHLEFQRNPSREMNAQQLPMNSPLLFSPHAIHNETSDLEPQIFIDNWPDRERFVFSNVSSWEKANSSFESYRNLTADFGNFSHPKPPLFYSGYGIFRANNTAKNFQVINWLNLTQKGSTPVFPQLMYESILRVATNDSNFHFSTTIAPYPLLNMREEQQSGEDIHIGPLVVALAFSQLLVSIIGGLVDEGGSGLTHLQVVHGMQLRAYWLTNFIFDYVKITMLSGMTILAFHVYPGFGWHQFWIVAIVWPFGVLPFLYVLSKGFSNSGNAQMVILGTVFYSMMLLPMSISGTRFDYRTEAYGDRQLWIYRFTPFFPLGWSILNEALIEDLHRIRSRDLPFPGDGYEIDLNLNSMQNFYGDIIGILASCLFWITLLVLIETNSFQRRHNRTGTERLRANLVKKQDPDVHEEEERVKKGCKSDVLVQDFSKDYSVWQGCGQRKFRAVNSLSFALRAGECFALLGVNGAGKSTTFKTLTKEVTPSQGQVRIGKFDLHKNFGEARKQIGYCPQHNLIYQDMSVIQLVWYFASIKGIPSNVIDGICEDAIQQLGLDEHRDKLSGALSGGNQRKLCVALAIVGNPPIILLDEPSAGMDPGARRFMWQVVGDIAKAQTSAVVLTTHSMEEAEALCSKMAIMVKGGIFRCFGPAQHIKHKYGTGYVIEIKVRKLPYDELPSVGRKFYQGNGGCNLDLHSQDNVSRELLDEIVKVERDLETYEEKVRHVYTETNLLSIIFSLAEIFNQVELIEQFSNFIRVRVARQDKSIGFVFGLIEKLYKTYDIAEFSVSQTTLEQIFQSFADENFDENIRTFAITDKLLTEKH